MKINILLLALLFSSSTFAEDSNHFSLNHSDMIITNHGNFGRIVEADSKRAKVYFLGSQKERFFHVASLAKTEGCSVNSNEFCVGSTVSTKHENNGIVQGVFSNGDVLVMFFESKSYQKRKVSDLSLL